MRFAIIDCGTNTFNLLLAESTAGVLKIVQEQKLPVKIGKGGIANGIITEEACRRALQALGEYAAQLENFKPDQVFAFATAAFRRAENGDELKARILSETGIEIQTISGKEEARLIAKGVRHGYPTTEPILIMDIGGGSTEFIISKGEEILESWSFEIGASRMLEEFQPSDPIIAAEVLKIESYLKELLQPVFDKALQFAIDTLVGSSGFFDTLGEMAYHHFHLTEDPKQKLFYPVSPVQFEELYELVLPLPLEERLKIPGLIPFRADMIVVSFLQANLVLKSSQAQRIISTRYSLKEGILFDKFAH